MLEDFSQSIKCAAQDQLRSSLQLWKRHVVSVWKRKVCISKSEFSVLGTILPHPYHGG